MRSRISSRPSFYCTLLAKSSASSFARSARFSASGKSCLRAVSACRMKARTRLTSSACSGFGPRCSTRARLRWAATRLPSIDLLYSLRSSGLRMRPSRRPDGGAGATDSDGVTDSLDASLTSALSASSSVVCRGGSTANGGGTSGIASGGIGCGGGSVATVCGSETGADGILGGSGTGAATAGVSGGGAVSLFPQATTAAQAARMITSPAARAVALVFGRGSRMPEFTHRFPGPQPGRLTLRGSAARPWPAGISAETLCPRFVCW